tara:strand:- start:2292 stop:3323 length:1032 start_codon:yes stop_codon:yes gene_type:complete
VKSTENTGVRRICANLPEELIQGVDHLKKEWGLRSRGAVLERLLEDLFNDDISTLVNDDNVLLDKSTDNEEINYEEKYNENKAIILVGNNDLELVNNNKTEYSDKSQKSNVQIHNTNFDIDLPGFVRSRTNNLKKSLIRDKKRITDFDSFIKTVKESEIKASINSAKEHWISLYGNKPGENVLEAAMIWLARDIWPHIEGSDDKAFTWSTVNKLMSEYCVSWSDCAPNFERIIVMAGVLEDPFSSNNLKTRVPTIIRRFVNRFKRLQNTTSFQTIESTMTVHGALKLLDLPTTAGYSVTLKTIREAYKKKAMENHPDSGGNTEIMRKLNEGYQLLKDLYKSRQ